MNEDTETKDITSGQGRTGGIFSIEPIVGGEAPNRNKRSLSKSSVGCPIVVKFCILRVPESCKLRSLTCYILHIHL